MSTESLQLPEFIDTLKLGESRPNAWKDELKTVDKVVAQSLKDFVSIDTRGAGGFYQVRAEVLLAQHGLINDPNTISGNDYEDARTAVAKVVVKDRPEVAAHALAVELVMDKNQEYLALDIFQGIMQESKTKGGNEFQNVKAALLAALTSRALVIPDDIYSNTDFLYYLDELEGADPAQADGTSQTPLSDVCKQVADYYLRERGVRQREIKEAVAQAQAEAARASQEQATAMAEQTARMAKMQAKIDELRAAQAQQAIAEEATARATEATPPTADTELRKANETLLAEVQRLTQELKAKAQAVDILSEQVTRKDGTIANLQAEEQRRKSELADLKSKADQYDSVLYEKSRLTEEVARVRAEAATQAQNHVSTLAELQAKIAENELETSRRVREATRATAAANTGEVMEAEAAKEKAERALQAKVQENDGLKTEIAEALKRIEKLQGTVERLGQEKDDITKQLQEAQSLADGRQATIEAQARSNASQNREIVAKENEIREMGRAATELKETVRTLRDNAKKLQEQIARFESEDYRREVAKVIYEQKKAAEQSLENIAAQIQRLHKALYRPSGVRFETEVPADELDNENKLQIMADYVIQITDTLGAIAHAIDIDEKRLQEMKPSEFTSAVTKRIAELAKQVAELKDKTRAVEQGQSTPELVEKTLPATAHLENMPFTARERPEALTDVKLEEETTVTLEQAKMSFANRCMEHIKPTPSEQQALQIAEIYAQVISNMGEVQNPIITIINAVKPLMIERGLQAFTVVARNIEIMNAIKELMAVAKIK